MGMMERPMNRNCRSLFWYLVLVSFVLWSLLLYFHYSSMVISKNEVIIIGDNNTNIIVSRDYDSVHVHGNYGERIGELHDKGNIFGEGTGEFTEKVNDNNVGNDVGKKNENAPIDFFVDGVDVDQMMMNLGEELEPDIETPIEEESSNEVASVENGSEPVDSLPVEGRRKKIAKQLKRENGVRVESDAESCSGKYIYVHHLPRRFNVDLLRDCRSLSEWTNMCVFTSNLGLGPHFPNVEKVYSKTGWFATNQFMLGVIFHNRMKQYKCLTNDSSLASATFVPYYAGIDVARYLWGSNPYLKDTDSLELVKWLRQKPEWKRMSGRDHFSVAGRITWDFRRSSNRVSDWGNKHFLLPETRKMTMLVIESSPWNNNDFAIPYPTYFHPSSDQEVFQWQNRMRRQKRNFLFSFAGGGRPNISDSIRNEIMDQCRASRRKCSLLDCDDTANKCHNPVNLMKLFQNSIFCLQPPGDSFTRRSTFDSILAGCIPVFFHPGSAYAQYLWHLPKDYAKYSVFIPANQVKDGKVSIERVLSQIPTRKVIAMREEVIRLISRVIYADPRSRLETLEDAFDITIKGVLERVETTRREMREGKNLTADITEELSWKYNLFGTLEEHEWDPFFVRTNDVNNH